MKSTKPSLFNFSFLILCALLPGFGENVYAKSNAEKLVGVVAPLTGEGATYGASMRRGITLAFDEEKGIRLIFEDSKFQAKDAVMAMKKLISVDKVDAVYGEAGSGITAALIPIANASKVVLISSISSSDKLTSKDGYFFRNVPRNSLQAQTAAEYLKKHDLLKVAVFNKNDEYGANLAKLFKASAESTGLKIVDDSSYLASDTDFHSQLTRIRDSGAAAVFVPGNYQDVGMVIRQAKEVGLNATIISGDGAYSPDLIQYAGDAAEGVVCTVMSVDKSTPAYKEFEEKFVKAYGQKPDTYDTYAYEAGRILLKALKESQGNLRDYMAAASFDTFAGSLQFDGSDMIRPYGIEVIRNGRFVEE